jgi:hypothetical protein
LISNQEGGKKKMKLQKLIMKKNKSTLAPAHSMQILKDAHQKHVDDSSETKIVLYLKVSDPETMAAHTLLNICQRPCSAAPLSINHMMYCQQIWDKSFSLIMQSNAYLDGLFPLVHAHIIKMCPNVSFGRRLMEFLEAGQHGRDFVQITGIIGMIPTHGLCVCCKQETTLEFVIHIEQSSYTPPASIIPCYESMWALDFNCHNQMVKLLRIYHHLWSVSRPFDKKWDYQGFACWETPHYKYGPLNSVSGEITRRAHADLITLIQQIK